MGTKCLVGLRVEGLAPGAYILLAAQHVVRAVETGWGGLSRDRLVGELRRRVIGWERENWAPIPGGPIGRPIGCW